jgi:hypothetical protein
VGSGAHPTGVMLMRRQFPVGGGRRAPVEGSDRKRVLQHRGKGKKVRCGPIEREKVAWEELTEEGRLAAVLRMISARRWLSIDRGWTRDR